MQYSITVYYLYVVPYNLINNYLELFMMLIDIKYFTMTHSEYYVRKDGVRIFFTPGK